MAGRRRARGADTHLGDLGPSLSGQAATAHRSPRMRPQGGQGADWAACWPSPATRHGSRTSAKARLIFFCLRILQFHGLHRREGGGCPDGQRSWDWGPELSLWPLYVAWFSPSMAAGFLEGARQVSEQGPAGFSVAAQGVT